MVSFLIGLAIAAATAASESAVVTAVVTGAAGAAGAYGAKEVIRAAGGKADRGGRVHTRPKRRGSHKGGRKKTGRGKPKGKQKRQPCRCR